MLRTKSIYKPKHVDDGARILVSRYYPRGVKRTHFDDWMRQLAPSPSLLRRYKQGIVTSEEYTIEYKTEIDNDDALQALCKLKHAAEAGNVTLLCYEPEGEFCHRCILKELLLTVPPARTGDDLNNPRYIPQSDSNQGCAGHQDVF